jgi:hypothetical protein
MPAIVLSEKALLLIMLIMENLLTETIQSVGKMTQEEITKKITIENTRKAKNTAKIKDH